MLCQTVKSVLAQTYQDLEIIVIDDCSGDDTAKIAELSSAVTYICNQSNNGPGYSRRQGLLHSRGEYIVFLDDDDYYTDCDFYKKAAEILDKNPSYCFVAANAEVYHEDTGLTDGELLDDIGECSAAEYLEGIPFENRKPYSTFTTVFRKETLLKAEVDKMEMVNDMPIYMRCLTAGEKVFFLEEIIGVYRIHSSNISKRMTPEFIIANLKEKKDTLCRIKTLKLFEKYNIWWEKQVRVTLDYLLFDSKPTFFEYWTVRKWCIDNSENKEEIRKLTERYTAIMIDRRVYCIKLAIKRLIGTGKR